jgi:DNA polymerase-3 subunit epsilon
MRKLAFVDVETTGLQADLHEVWEVAVRLTDPTGFTPLDHYTAMLKPKRLDKAEPKALEVNAYHTRFDPAAARSAAEVVANIARLTQDAILVGQNVMFDIGFLTTMFINESVAIPWHYHSLDISTLWHPVRLEKGLESSSLHVIASALGVKQTLRHEAAADVETAWNCYKALMRRFAPNLQVNGVAISTLP